MCVEHCSILVESRLEQLELCYMEMLSMVKAEKELRIVAPKSRGLQKCRWERSLFKSRYPYGF